MTKVHQLILNSCLIKCLLICLSIFIQCLTTVNILYADIVTDGSVGTVQSLTGPDYAIPETLGTLKGDNLFHSFDKFSIKTEESATFTGPDSIKNVISRVTGGEQSNIDGTLRSNVGNADFYFINPNGVLFGPNATVNVPAAFHVSTADELKFADGSSFRASKTEISTLTQAAPEAFGFLGTQSASIEVNGSTFEFKPGSKVSLISSKDITIKGTEGKQASLLTQGGEITLTAKGDLSMENATVATSGNGGGKVIVKASNVRIQNNSTIAVNNTGDKNSDGGITVDVDNQLELRDDSNILSNTFSEGDAGSLTVNADELTIRNAGKIGNSTWSKGNAGNIKINANELTIDGQEQQPATTGIGSYANTYSEGHSGNMDITVSGLTQFLNGGGILNSTFSKGDGGNVILNTGELIIKNGGGISSATWSKGNAGSVEVNASELTIDGQGLLVNDMPGTAIGSFAQYNSEGSAGRVEITVSGLMQLLNFGVIASHTWSEVDAGGVSVNAGEVIIKNGAGIASHTWSKGDAGSVIVNAKEMTIDGQGLLVKGAPATGIGSVAQENSGGNSGGVEVTVSGLTQLMNVGSISSSTLSKGDAGTLVVNAGKLTLRSGAAITSATLSKGDAGTLVVNADELQISSGAVIASSTFSEGDAATLVLNADELTIDGQGTYSLTGIASIANPNSEGNAGKIIATVSGLMHLVNTGRVLTSTWSKGDAGNLTVNASDLILDSSYIQSASSSDSTGYSTIYVPNALPSPITGYVGNVIVNADSITLLNSSEISIASLQTLSEEKSVNIPDNAITLNTEQLNIESESRITSESKKNAPASDININADTIFLHNGQITTSVSDNEGNGDGGNITISGLTTSPDTPAEFADFLVMQNGFVQANTTAKKAEGGRIAINATALIKESNAILEIGGDKIQEFLVNSSRNIIQAAAPEGNPKNDDIQTPEMPLDLSGSIINADLRFAEPAKMATNHCSTIGTKRASSLIEGGRGGIPEQPDELSSIPFDENQLDELLTDSNKQ